MRLRLVHWNPAEARDRARSVQAAGHEVDFAVPAGPAFFRELAANLPDAVVISLDRLPMQGRDFGAVIRTRAALRRLPLVFAGGAPEKVKNVRLLLPDETYCEWNALNAALARALAKPAPVIRRRGMAAYAATPLARKLGLKPGMAVEVLGDPGGFEIPEDVRHTSRDPAMTLWFVRSRAELENEIEFMATRVRMGPLWIFWPKKSHSPRSGLTPDVIQSATRRTGLAQYKILSLDQTWSGLLFTAARKRR